VAVRWLPIAIALAAAGAETLGAHGLAFYLLLAAVPLNAGCALVLFGEVLDARAAGPVEPAIALEPLLAGLALLVLVAGVAAGSVVFALSGCLVLYLTRVVVGLGVELRSPTPEPG
jgi:hypothetical protein